jgi:hypothetical protein
MAVDVVVVVHIRGQAGRRLSAIRKTSPTKWFADIVFGRCSRRLIRSGELICLLVQLRAYGFWGLEAIGE